jgi:hypothetical protein
LYICPAHFSYTVFTSDFLSLETVDDAVGLNYNIQAIAPSAANTTPPVSPASTVIAAPVDAVELERVSLDVVVAASVVVDVLSSVSEGIEAEIEDIIDSAADVAEAAGLLEGFC